MSVRVGRPLFITPHAIERFRTYAANWNRQAIIEWLNVNLQRLPDEVDVKSGALWYRLNFGGRSLVAVVGRGEGEWLSVLTIVGDTQRLDRWLRRRGRNWSSRDSQRLRVLKSYGFGPLGCAAVMDKPVTEIVKRWG